MNTPCTFHGCPDPAGWAVSGQPLCRRHMLDAAIENGFGTLTAVRIPREPEPAAPADLVDELRHVADLVGDRGVGYASSVGVAVDPLLDRAADEIERLRMTSEEVRAVKALLHQVEVSNPQWAATLRGLLERLK